MKFNELGRSMVEMLGVLAIIGVLSVGALSGYSKAMTKYKLNKQSEQISQLLDYTLINTEKLRNDNSEMLVPLLVKLNAIPDGMKSNIGNTYVFDVFNSSIWIENHHPGFALGIIINNNSELNMEICRNLLKLAQARSHLIDFSYIHRFNSDDTVDALDRKYGDAKCTKGNCLRDMTIADMDDMCRVCEGVKECHVFVNWDYYNN